MIAKQQAIGFHAPSQMKPTDPAIPAVRLNTAAQRAGITNEMPAVPIKREAALNPKSFVDELPYALFSERTSARGVLAASRSKSDQLSAYFTERASFAPQLQSQPQAIQSQLLCFSSVNGTTLP